MNVSNPAFAHKLPPPEEEMADRAYAELWHLRDRLVRMNENRAACLVDDAIEDLRKACKEFVK